MDARRLVLSFFAAGTLALDLGCGQGSAEDVTALDEEQAPNVVYQAGSELEVTADNLDLLQAPAAGQPVMGVLPRGTVVIAFETSGEGGFVHVMAPDIGPDDKEGVGFVSTKYVKPAASGVQGARGAPATGGNCDPSGAQNAVGRYQKALHDVLAYAEGTRDYSRDGYDVMYSFKLFGSCTSHPNQCLKFGRTCSTAAGRYQFLTRTWNGAKSARSLSSFEPANQERAAEYLIGTVRKVTIPQDRALTAAEFTNMTSKLSYEWASLPPGRYGQPKRSEAVLRADYCRLAGCDGNTIEPVETCAGKDDGYYCSPLQPSAAYGCRAGQQTGVTFCETGKCKADAEGRASLANAKLVCQ